MLAIRLLVELAVPACRRRSGRAQTPAPSASGPPTMDAAVAAGLNALRHVQDVVAAHHERLAAQRGVASISAVGDALGARVRIELCAEEAREGLVIGSLGVPVEVTVGAGGTTARGALCGCAQAGRYYEAGETYPVDCNTCRCVGANQSADCTMKVCDAAISRPDAATPPGLGAP